MPDFDEIIRLVDDCLHPEKQDRRRSLPVVLVWSPRDNGQSGLLDQLEERFKPGRPFVRCSQHEDMQRAHQVALRLALDLSEKVRGFGRPTFERLLLGVAATRGPFNFEDPSATREGMLERTIPDRRLLKKLLRATLPVLTRLVGASPGSRLYELAEEAVLALVDKLRTRPPTWTGPPIGAPGRHRRGCIRCCFANSTSTRHTC